MQDVEGLEKLKGMPKGELQRQQQGEPAMGTAPRVSIVLLTHDRPEDLARTLAHLAQLPEHPPLIVVDNGSRPGSVEAVLRARTYGLDAQSATLTRCATNLGAAGRNQGVALVRTPYVAFCDDDTWWEPGALQLAADLLDRHTDIAVLCARVLVGTEQREDPTCRSMACSKLPSAGLPGPRLIAFMAGAAVMRTAAFRSVGGYESRLFLGAEEWLMSLDLLAHGWSIVYAHDVVTHHHPSPRGRNPVARCVTVARNRLWIAWMRLSLVSALGTSLALLREARGCGLLSKVVLEATRGFAWVLAHRKPVPPSVERLWRKVQQERHGKPHAFSRKG